MCPIGAAEVAAAGRTPEEKRWCAAHPANNNWLKEFPEHDQ
ncbi:hypothetical protein [Desulfofundulus thermobenzoicus]|nr:hypothetical protein [Desulfofundulus thermobenzoicus]